MLFTSAYFCIFNNLSFSKTVMSIHKRSHLLKSGQRHSLFNFIDPKAHVRTTSTGPGAQRVYLSHRRVMWHSTGTDRPDSVLGMLKL